MRSSCREPRGWHFTDRLELGDEFVEPRQSPSKALLHDRRVGKMKEQHRPVERPRTGFRASSWRCMPLRNSDRPWVLFCRLSGYRHA